MRRRGLVWRALRAWAVLLEPSRPASPALLPPLLFLLRAEPVSLVPHPKYALPSPDPTVLQVLASSPTLPGGTLRSTSYVGHPLTEGRAWKASAKQFCPLGSRNTLSPLGSGQLSLSQTREAKDRGRRLVQIDTVIGNRGPGTGGRRGHSPSYRTLGS